ncbi:uncharacterized protein LOC134231500 [Saccostrea cucullata]|uniref:uncharacterized protein LOC134231500 n=1 Tax=Saccostrea cuccullata TaxID=36930 RepID=UPI002ED2CCF7
MSHNAKYYRKKISTKTTDKCKKIDTLFKQQAAAQQLTESHSELVVTDTQPTEQETTKQNESEEIQTDSVPSEEFEVNQIEANPESLAKSDTDTDDYEPPKKLKIQDSRKKSAISHELAFPWLYHSAAKEAYFCKYCEFRYGDCKSDSTATSPFATGGVKSLGTHPTRKLEKHHKSEAHQQAETIYLGTGKSDQSPSILQLLQQQNDALKEQDKKRNLEYLETLFKTTIFMLSKRWAITDNLKDMIKFLGDELKYKPVADYFDYHPTITYTSPSSVQDIVSSLSFSIESEILEAIRKAEWYSLLADESADDANREQFAVIIRFVDGGKIREVFLGLLKLQCTDAESLTSSLESILIAKGLDVSKAIFVGFDGCNVMSGVNTGVQRRFRHLVPHQVYINCRNHKLVLCVKHLIKEFPVLEELDSLLLGIWKLFHYSPKRYAVFEEIQETYHQKKLKFIRAAATRWLSHGRACVRLLDRFSSILDSLDAIYDAKKEPEILGYRNMLTDKKTIAAATVLCDALKPVVIFSDYLQGDVHFSRVNMKVKELTDELHHLTERYRVCAEGNDADPDVDLHFSRLPTYWAEIDDRTELARRIRL